MHFMLILMILVMMIVNCIYDYGVFLGWWCGAGGGIHF